MLDLNADPALFADPEGDELTYTATSSAPGIASAAIESSILTVTPLAEGSATIQIGADDGRQGTASSSFGVTIGSAIAPGDVNEDGRITLVDALFTLQASLGKRTLLPAQERAADVNRDSRITLVDALFILQASLGKRDLSSAKPIVDAAAGEDGPVALQGFFEDEEEARLFLSVSGLAAGALDLHLRFDPARLNWVGFEPAEPEQPAVVEVHAPQPGELRLERLARIPPGQAKLGQLLFQRRSRDVPAEVVVGALNFST